MPELEYYFCPDEPTVAIVDDSSVADMLAAKIQKNSRCTIAVCRNFSNLNRDVIGRHPDFILARLSAGDGKKVGRWYETMNYVHPILDSVKLAFLLPGEQAESNDTVYRPCDLDELAKRVRRELDKNVIGSMHRRYQMLAMYLPPPELDRKLCETLRRPLELAHLPDVEPRDYLLDLLRLGVRCKCPHVPWSVAKRLNLSNEEDSLQELQLAAMVGMAHDKRGDALTARIQRMFHRRWKAVFAERFNDACGSMLPTEPPLKLNDFLKAVLRHYKEDPEMRTFEEALKKERELSDLLRQ